MQTILKRRYRNGYRVIEQSEGFPELEILKEIPVVDNVAGQMRLFWTKKLLFKSTSQA